MKKLRLVMVLVMTCIFLTGCRFGNGVVITTTRLTDNEVFIISEEKCSVALMKMMLANQMSLQKDNYGIDLLDNEDFRVQKKFEQYIKTLSLEEMSTVYSMALLADSYVSSGATDIGLTDSEKEQTSWAAEEYVSSMSPEEKEATGVTKEEVEALYARYIKAMKVKDHIVRDVNSEVSDNEARVIDAEQIFITNDANVSKVGQELAAGSMFITVASNYNEADHIAVSVKRGDYPAEVEKVLYDMEDDEVSGVIRTDEGAYFFHCVNKNDENLTEANKGTILAKRQEDAFNQIYDPFLRLLSSQLNDKVWAEISLEELKVISTGDFYKIFEKYCSYDLRN